MTLHDLYIKVPTVLIPKNLKEKPYHPIILISNSTEVLLHFLNLTLKNSLVETTKVKKSCIKNAVNLQMSAQFTLGFTIEYFSTKLKLVV